MATVVNTIDLAVLRNHKCPEEGDFVGPQEIQPISSYTCHEYNSGYWINILYPKVAVEIVDSVAKGSMEKINLVLAGRQADRLIYLHLMTGPPIVVRSGNVLYNVEGVLEISLDGEVLYFLKLATIEKWFWVNHEETYKAIVTRLNGTNTSRALVVLNINQERNSVVSSTLEKGSSGQARTEEPPADVVKGNHGPKKTVIFCSVIGALGLVALGFYIYVRYGEFIKSCFKNEDGADGSPV